IETHYVNTSPDPILREVWINIVYSDPDKVKTKIDSVFWIGGLAMNVQPHTKESIVAGPAVQPPAPDGQSIRILGISGHVHAHTTHESVWINRAAGGKDLIYETYNWQEPLIAEFDSVHKNPKPGVSTTSDGAFTGALTLEPGDTVSWQCDVDNTTEKPLKFADLAYSA